MQWSAYVNVKKVAMCSYPRKLFGRFSQVSPIKALSELLYTKEKEIFLGSVKVRICCDDTSGWYSLGFLKVFSIPPHKPEPKEFRSPLPGFVSKNIIRTTGFVHLLFLQKSV